MKNPKRHSTLESIKLPDIITNYGYSKQLKKLPQNLIHRIDQNEKASVKKQLGNNTSWFNKTKHNTDSNLNCINEHNVDNIYYRLPTTPQLRYNLKRGSYFAKRNIVTPLDANLRERSDESMDEERNRRREEALARFTSMVVRVQTLLRVFRQMRMYAIEKGQHLRDIGSVIKEEEDSDFVRTDLLFNVDNFKSKHRFCMPAWACDVCSLAPEERTKTDIKNLVQLMQTLKGFSKYSPTEQELLAMTVRYEKFGRRRVVIRKGHIGTAFYLIYSGSVAVVVQGDEDVPFVEGHKPAIIMKRGDSFGELALVKSVARSATVVCLEKTEFFVVDNESFFRFGIDAFSKDEIEYRHSCIKSLELFQDIDEFSCRQIAEECREFTYLTEKVIEPDSTESKFVYFVTKGKCYVLRNLNLAEQQKRVENKKSRRRTQSRVLTSSSRNNISQGTCSTGLFPILPSISSVPSSLSLYIDEEASENPHEQDDFSDSNRSTAQWKKCSLATHSQNNCSLRNKTLRKIKAAKRKKIEYGGYDKHPYVDQNLVYLKVEILTRGKSFGLQAIKDRSQEGGELKDARKFVFVSSGCQLIRIPVKLIENIAKGQVLKKIKSMVVDYPSDEQLYAEFRCFEDWCCFRKNIVHGKAFKNDVYG